MIFMETDEQEAIEEAESRKLDALLRQQRINTINTLKSQNERLVRELAWAIEAIEPSDRNIKRLREAKAALPATSPACMLLTSTIFSPRPGLPLNGRNFPAFLMR